jgi:aryl-alcohol dehydrogenase-like predicted oxidoreductase
MVDKGVNLIDTAPCYGNGTAEKIVGEAVHDIRDKVMISSKFGLVSDIYTRGYGRDASYKNCMREIATTHMNHKTDHLDFYFVHWPDPNTPISETMNALMWLKKEGYIRFIGVSNFTSEQMEKARQYGVIDVIQPMYSMIDRHEEELMKQSYDAGIDSFTYASMGAGILSGKYRQIPEFEKGDLRTTFYDYFREPKFSKIQELLNVMDVIAEAHNVPVAQVALNWSTQKEFVATTLVGVRTPAHADENTAGFDWELTSEEMKTLDNKLDSLHIEKKQ